MPKINKYDSSNGYSVVYTNDAIRIITGDNLEIEDDFMYLPKKLVKFILELENLPSPLPFILTTLNQEIGGLVDLIGYSPDEQTGILFFKEVYYITK